MERNAILYAVVKADGAQHNKSFTVWHETLDAARAEAERLAGQTRQSFYVIQTVGVAKPATTPIEWVLCD